MKRFISLFCILICVASYAGVIEEPSCRSRAAEVLRDACPSGGKVSMELVRSGGFSSSSSVNPEYYIYNNTEGKGFVIVSADESVPPVLGYSTECSYSADNLPENFVSWMQMWDKIISAGRAAGINCRQPSRYVSYSSLPAECQLETALWDQGAPYNDLCPKEGRDRCVTGCTATATCIVMHYNRWPDAGVGTLPSYSYTMDSGKRNTVEGVELGEKYDWDNMLMRYDGMATAQQKRAVAVLMHHVGVMIRSAYNAGGTGAFPDDVCEGLVKYMKYDQSTDIFSASCFAPAVWIEKLKKSISSNYPVIYAGYSTTYSGHCFVLDGYNSKNEMHINFGWGGMMNGMFTFPEFSEYTIGHSAIFNARKDEGGHKPDNVFITDRGLSAGTSTFRPGEKFDVSINYLANFSSDAFNGEIALAKADSKDNVLEILSTKSCSLSGGRRVSFKFTDVALSSKPKIGEKMIVLFRSDRTPEWEEALFDRESSVVGELPIADAYSIEDATTVSYNVSSAVATVKTKNGVAMSLVDASGVQITQGVTVKGTQMNITASALKEGEYVIKLSKDEEYKELKVKLGTKK